MFSVQYFSNNLASRAVSSDICGKQKKPWQQRYGKSYKKLALNLSVLLV